MALALGLGAVPAVAFPVSAVSESSTADAATSEIPVSGSEAGVSESGLAEAGLTEAVLRDLGLTPEEFDAAGQLGKEASDVVAALRDVPGYLGTRLLDGRTLVAGSGPELETKVAQLAAAFPAVALEAPPASPASTTPATDTSAAGAGTETPAATGTELAASTQQLFQAYLRDVGPEGLQAVVTSGGKFVIRTGGINSPQSASDSSTSSTAAAPGNGKMSPAEFVSRYSNVSLDDGARLAPEADVPGGLGYRADNGYVCSTGFSAFDPAGLPAVLTAGHCSYDGAAKSATLELQGTPAGLLGQFGFSQFGGPGNSRVLRPGNSQDPGNVGTDIAVIGALRQDLDPLPAASTWGDQAEPGPDRKIIGTAAPVAGMRVCRSGRSSAWSCGYIDEVGIFVVPGLTYPADLKDFRAFNGFLSFDVQSSGGDSGGPWVSGNYAIGTHSAGDTLENGKVIQNFAVAATLQDSLNVLPGYQLELFLNKPTMTSPAPGSTVEAGQPVTGKVPAAPASAIAADSKVLITVAGQQPIEVPVNDAGSWSFNAPLPAGPLTFTAETVNGSSRSGAASLTAEVAPSPLAAPTITTPDTAPLTELTSLSGTGASGATVTLTGDVAGFGTVGLDGLWSIPLTGPDVFGKVKATAMLSSPGIADSPTVTGTFTVIPPAPAISSLSDGQHLRQGALPATISGSGVNGAEVTVSIDGVPLSGTQAGGGAGSRSVAPTVAPLVLVADGGWSILFPDGMALGSHTVSVMQAVDGFASSPVVATFFIDAPPAAAPAAPAESPPPADVPTTIGAVPPASDSAAVVRPLGDSDSRAASLADTGASGLILTGSLAAGALAVGGVFLVLSRRRKRQRSTPTR